MFDGMPVQSFVSLDLWQNFANDNTVVFNDRGVVTGMNGTSLEVRSGVAMRVTTTASAYASFGCTTSLSEENRRSIGGNVGMRMVW